MCFRMLAGVRESALSGLVPLANMTPDAGQGAWDYSVRVRDVSGGVAGPRRNLTSGLRKIGRTDETILPPCLIHGNRCGIR